MPYHSKNGAIATVTRRGAGEEVEAGTVRRKKSPAAVDGAVSLSYASAVRRVYHLKQLHNLKESEEQHPHTTKPVHKSLEHLEFLSSSLRLDTLPYLLIRLTTPLNQGSGQ